MAHQHNIPAMRSDVFTVHGSNIVPGMVLDLSGIHGSLGAGGGILLDGPMEVIALDDIRSGFALGAWVAAEDGNTSEVHVNLQPAWSYAVVG